jgi:hypothetical protein
LDQEMNPGLSQLRSRWARAGAMFCADLAPTIPDMERLLLDTARRCRRNSRLFIMATTWLAQYGSTRIHSRRLAELIRNELEAVHRPVLGFLLATACQFSGRRDFCEAIAECSPAAEPGPLFEIYRRNPLLLQRSYRQASPLSKEWGLWAEAIQPKYDAIRPESWVKANTVSHPA